MLENKFTPQEAAIKYMDHKEKTATQTQVERFVRNPEHITDAKPGLMCGDGRYEETQGRIARFGASGGYLLGLLGLSREFDLGLTPEQAVSSTLQASEGKVFLHTECGHLAKPGHDEFKDQYKLDPLEVNTAVKLLFAAGQKDPEHVEVIEVHGPHLEKAVLRNKGKNKKIVHRDANEEYFEIDDAREKDYAQGFWKGLQEALPQIKEKDIRYEDFRKILDEQTAATAHILALGLPIFDVDADGDEAIVEFAGNIE